MLTYTSSPISVHLSAQSDEKQPLAEQKAQLEEFWKLETLGIREPVQEKEEDKALQTFNETIHFEDGRYQVTLPWKEDSSSLPNNWQWECWHPKSIDCHEMINISRNVMR